MGGGGGGGGGVSTSGVHYIMEYKYVLCHDHGIDNVEDNVAMSY